MTDARPLSALLSQILVAFTIEFDNEFERLVPHRTSKKNYRDTTFPWLVSMVMWLQILRFVPDEGIGVKELYRLTDLSREAFRQRLIRLSKWWSYVSVSDMMVRPRPGGLKALQVWRPLTGQIQNRWQERFGKDLGALMDVMETISTKLGPGYPDYMPILGYELLTTLPEPRTGAPIRSNRDSQSTQALPVLLAKLLVAFAVEFETRSSLSLAVSANLLRFTGDEGVRVRDLPRLSGVSKEAIAMALRRAEECGLGSVQKEAGSARVNAFVLTPAGRRARQQYHELTSAIESEWAQKYGRDNMAQLRELAERVAGPDSDSSVLFKSLQSYPDGWRAAVPAPNRLPHSPMVLHRGGFPDGS